MGRSFAFLPDDGCHRDTPEPAFQTSKTGTFRVPSHVLGACLHEKKESCSLLAHTTSPESKTVFVTDYSSEQLAYGFQLERCRKNALATRVQSWIYALGTVSQVESYPGTTKTNVSDVLENARKALEAIILARSEVDQLETDRKALRECEAAIAEDTGRKQAEASRLKSESLLVNPGIAYPEFEEFKHASLLTLNGYEVFGHMTDEVTKSKAMEVRMAVNRRVGQIANSRRQISDIVQQLKQTISGMRSLYPDSGAEYTITLIARKIVDQAESQICLHTPSSFPIAQAVVDLSVQEASLLPILVHMMHTRCPYLIPKFVTRSTDQTDVEYKLALGYLKSDDGTLESDAAYYERMAGIVCLFGAITQAEPTIRGVSNPVGLPRGWNWLARVLNLKPEPITPFLICSFLESAGYKLWRLQGDVFAKLLRSIKTQILDLIPESAVAAKTRLDIFISEFFSRSPPSLPEPKGHALLP